MRWLAAALILTSACAPTVDSSARVERPPDDVRHVAALRMDSMGNFIDGSPVVGRRGDEDFVEPFKAGEEGEELRLFGYTDAQLEVCSPRAPDELRRAKLTPTSHASAALPTPAWTVAGRWSNDFVELVSEPTDMYVTSSWIGAENSCAAFDASATTVPFFIKDPKAFYAIGDGSRATLLTMTTRYEVELATLETTTIVETASVAGPIGGFMDDLGRQWIFHRDGSLERVDLDGSSTTVATDGGWSGASQVFANGGQDESGEMEIILVASDGLLARWTPSTWDELTMLRIRPDRGSIVAAGLLWYPPGRTLIASDGSLDIVIVEEGRPRFVPAGTVNTGAPIALIDSERYGLITSTRFGVLFKSDDGEVWLPFVDVDENRASYNIFEVAAGLLFGGHRGELRFLHGDLEPCSDLPHADETVAYGVAYGDRVVLVEPKQSGTDEPQFVVLDFESIPVGCGLGP